MNESESVFAQIQDLRTRLEALELGSSSIGSGGMGEDQGPQQYGYCFVPVVPDPVLGPGVSVERASLLRVMSKKWVNGTVLHYYFYEGDEFGTTDAERNVVRQAFQRWKGLGIGIDFSEVTSREDSEIRIGFLRGDGAWSYVGRDVLTIGDNERTMNFGWDLTARASEINTAVHEIGHTLGFPHEHQNPNSGIVWNEEAVYREFAGFPNFWPRDKTEWNILRKIPQDTVEGSTWDSDSVMHYPFGPGLIVSPEPFRSGLQPAPGLSPVDESKVRFFYPELEVVLPELRPFRSQLLSLSKGQQRNFSVLPSFSRNYRFRTFGDSDTVMVLFEERDGELRYVKGDDDSGWDRNAAFRVRLQRGGRYVLRIRLYYQSASGDTALLMW